ncbi:MAG: VOC family protein [Alphaproteobacteria bacterium]|nr:VOC family protein [Alphaproteobacteria bacterium]MCB9792605.1 VOC family protein [Alphaproteobacteria bacterium]
MERVQGIGGVFFKASDPKGLAQWYAEHLGVPVEPWGGAVLRWADQHAADTASTTWSPFTEDTSYFGEGGKGHMLNFRVRDLAAMRAQLIAAGCAVDPKVEEGEYGKFGWVTDPEGNRVELWEPPEVAPGS